MSRDLPEPANLDQLRRQAKQLHRAALAGDRSALERVHTVSTKITLASAQLVLAREYGLPSWPRLKAEVERKKALTDGNVEALERLVAAHPELAVERISSRYSGPSMPVLAHVAVARFHGLVTHDRAAQITRVLVAAGAPVDGPPDAGETPLITAASYGEADMVRALIAAGADIEATGFAVPGGTALAHAVEFGNTDVVDALIAAGAIMHNIAQAAGAGNLHGFLTTQTSETDRAHALRAAAVNERLTVIDQLVATGLPVDADTDDSGATALHWAAWHGKPTAVRHLLTHGADHNRHDRRYDSTPLGWCRHRHGELAEFGEQPRHLEIERLLTPHTEEQ